MGVLDAVVSKKEYDMAARNEAAIRETKETRILRRKQVEARTGLSRSSIYARLSHNPKRPGDFDPTFPKPISVGAKAVGWIEAEIEAWLTAQILKSRTA
jgi:prophage regulatory protein